LLSFTDDRGRSPKTQAQADEKAKKQEFSEEIEMKTAGIVALIFAAILSALGQEQARKSESAKPIASMAWLVGGVWTADASRLGPGMQRIETRYEWSYNNAFIRFTTHF